MRGGQRTRRAQCPRGMVAHFPSPRPRRAHCMLWSDQALHVRTFPFRFILESHPLLVTKVSRVRLPRSCCAAAPAVVSALPVPLACPSLPPCSRADRSCFDSALTLRNFTFFNLTFFTGRIHPGSTGAATVFFRARAARAGSDSGGDDTASNSRSACSRASSSRCIASVRDGARPPRFALRVGAVCCASSIARRSSPAAACVRSFWQDLRLLPWIPAVALAAWSSSAASIVFSFFLFFFKNSCSEAF